MDRLLRTSQTDNAAKDCSEDQVALGDEDVIDVVDAEHISDYKLKLSFSDGSQRIIDLEPFLRTSRNPMIRAYLDPKRFAGFRVEYGDLIWDDYGLCFPVSDLYEDRL